MAPDPSSDPFVFASIHLLLQKQQPQKLPSLSRSSRSRSSGLSRLISSSTPGSGDGRRGHKKRSRRSGSSKVPLHYLKPGALAQLRDAQRSAARTTAASSACSCSKRKKRLSIADEADDAERPGHDSAAMAASATDATPQTPLAVTMTPGPSVRVFGPLCPQRKKLLAPKTPLPSVSSSIPPAMEAVTSVPSISGAVAADAAGSSDSMLEMLPLELLVRIVCNLHHDQLKPAFHVCRRLRQAVLIARQCHFDFTTPDRERQEALQLITPTADLNWPFTRTNEGAGPSRPPTPRAPRPAPKPVQARISFADMQQLAGPLFHGSANRLRRVKPPALPRPAFRAVASHRVLFYEEELCQAVAQNSI